MFDVWCLTVPTNISNLFIKANEKHNHEPRFSSSDNFYINPSKTESKPRFFLVLSFGIPFTMNFVNSQESFQKTYQWHVILVTRWEAEDDYDESPILLQKIANYRTYMLFIYVIYHWLLYPLSPPASNSTCYLRAEMDLMQMPGVNDSC